MMCSVSVLTVGGLMICGLVWYVMKLRRTLHEKTLLKRYAMSHSSIRESTTLLSLRHTTRDHPEGEMESSEDVGQLMVLLIHMIKAKRVLEIGTFTGVATLKIAESLPDDGKIVSLDIDETLVNIGRPFFEEANVSDKIEVKIEKACTSLQAMVDDGKEGYFDLAFIDADKYNYPSYYEYSLKLVRPGGVVVFDNSMFCRQLPWNTHKEPYSCIHEVNERAMQEPGVTSVLLTIGDGALIIWKHS